MTSEKNLPEMKFRAGAISATVWQNKGQNKEGQPTEYRTISLERGYKDKNGEWKSTNSFRINDLPRASLVLNEAYRYIVLKEMQNGAADAQQLDEEAIM
ncbi:hypothetical protein KY345_04345 [Candidatus Woesearchaeota archaeon]|nr:hypothetical protein [Candidatus Woesearchaeota archaeon]